MNNKKIPIFKNLSTPLKNSSCVLIKTEVLNSWLKEDKLCLVWLIGGGNLLFGKDIMRKGKEDRFSGIYFTNGDQIEGEISDFDVLSWGR
ncbi:MAG: hypothetical protein GDA46_07325 [Bdellovibrionales bacterium]|nr:hypothetical protein [Bdellovibrionales bacterium]